MHLSDIHIKKCDKSEEYKGVFNNLFENIILEISFEMFALRLFRNNICLLVTYIDNNDLIIRKKAPNNASIATSQGNLPAAANYTSQAAQANIQAANEAAVAVNAANNVTSGGKGKTTRKTTKKSASKKTKKR